MASSYSPHRQWCRQTSDIASSGRPDPDVESNSHGDGPEALLCITDDRGYLLRRRPGCNVPVGPRAAALLSKGFTDREVAMLMAVEQLGLVSAEQLGRAFFNTHRSAYEALLALARKRFLVNLCVDPQIIRRAVGHRPPQRNPVYALDWNGSYLLAHEQYYSLHNWRPATAARLTMRVGHTLGISDIWSYLVAAARATQEAAEVEDLVQGRFQGRCSVVPARLEQVGSSSKACETGTLKLAQQRSCSYHLSLAFRNERASLIYRRKAHLAQDGAPVKTRQGVLLQPDATFTFGIRRARAEQAPPHPAEQHGAYMPSVPSYAAHGGCTSRTRGSADPPQPVVAPRWSPTLDSWRPTLLASAPSAEVMLAAEKRAAAEPGHTYYRALLLEMETGANNRTDTATKIEQYNRLIRTDREAWASAYGVSPRVLVVVPIDSQIEDQALRWRMHYTYKQETAVLVTSLETLARTYGNRSRDSGSHDNSSTQEPTATQRRHGRHALVEQACWLDVMADRWRPLGEALGIEITR